VPFTRRDELVEIVGRILHGQEVATLPMATRLRDGRPITWQDVGQRIHDFLTELTADLSRSCWRSREHTISQLAAAPMSLADHGLTTSWRAAQQPLS
jgi:hypothetical protein